MKPWRNSSALYLRYQELMRELFAAGALPKRLYAVRPTRRAIARRTLLMAVGTILCGLTLTAMAQERIIHRPGENRPAASSTVPAEQYNKLLSDYFVLQSEYSKLLEKYTNLRGVKINHSFQGIQDTDGGLAVDKATGVMCRTWAWECVAGRDAIYGMKCSAVGQLPICSGLSE